MTAIHVSLVRDAKWLTLEVCREFQRGTCSRADADCKFAHPPRVCHVENGRVVACFDSLKGRCARENCKYLHPPPHLKTQLEVNGRNNLIQQKTFAAMFAQQMQFMLQNAQMSSATPFPVTPSVAANPTMAFGHYMPHPGMGLVHAELLPSTPVVFSGNPPLAFSSVGPKVIRSDKLEICREFQRGNCTRGENDCRYAHPTDASMIEACDNTVTVCMDYIKGRCCRERCKYFHPPPHLQAKLKAAHHQMNYVPTTAMVIPTGGFQLVAKRGIEKTNGITPVFNTSIMQCQQALANMQLQQPPYIPAVTMMHGATPTTVSATTSVTNTVPFAATAGNQIPPLSVDELNGSMFVSQM